VVLIEKGNYREWYRKIKSTLIFNDPWKVIFKEAMFHQRIKITEEEEELEEEASESKWKSSRPGSKLSIPTSNKDHEIWEDKDHKEYDVIYVMVSEEVIHIIVSISDSYGSLKILNELYDTHSELELIQLMLNLFNLELKNDDPMDLTSEIKYIVHDIQDIRVNIYIPLTAFIKALYPTYSYYLE
jgi:hypothetical protein